MRKKIKKYLKARHHSTLGFKEAADPCGNNLTSFSKMNLFEEAQTMKMIKYFSMIKYSV